VSPSKVALSTAADSGSFDVTFNKAMIAGQSYLGELLLGPPVAPTAMTVPVQISRTP
jgi:hypothetical protein